MKKARINMIFKLTYVYEDMLNNQPHTELILFHDIEILPYLVLDNKRVKLNTNKIRQPRFLNVWKLITRYF